MRGVAAPHSALWLSSLRHYRQSALHSRGMQCLHHLQSPVRGLPLSPPLQLLDLLVFPVVLVGVAVARAQVAPVVAALVAGMAIVGETRGQEERHLCEER